MTNKLVIDFFLKIMKSALLWPLKNDRHICLRILYGFGRISIGLILFYITLGLVIQAILMPSNLNEISNTIEIATLTGSALYKMVFIIKHERQFLQIVDYVNGNFILKFSGDNRISRSVFVFQLLSWLYISYGLACMLFWCSIPLLNNDKSWSGLPISCWFPFQTDRSPIYEIVYFVEAVALNMSVYLYLANDVFFFFLIYATRIQFTILSTMMSDISTTNIDNENIETIFSMTKNDGRSEIIYHRRLRAVIYQRTGMREKLNSACVYFKLFLVFLCYAVLIHNSFLIATFYRQNVKKLLLKKIEN